MVREKRLDKNDPDRFDNEYDDVKLLLRNDKRQKEYICLLYTSPSPRDS